VLDVDFFLKTLVLAFEPFDITRMFSATAATDAIAVNRSGGAHPGRPRVGRVGVNDSELRIKDRERNTQQRSNL